MMSKALSVKTKNPFLKMVFFTLNKNKALIILSGILSLLISPVFPLVTSSREEHLSSAEYSQIILTALFVTWLVSAGITLLLTAINLSFMHNKSGSDLFFALPMTRRCLFASRITASFIGGIIPMVIPTVFSAVLLLSDSTSGKYYAFHAVMFFLLSALSFIILTVVGGFFMVFSGRTFEAVISLLILNIGLPVLTLIVTEQMTSNLYGMPQTTFSKEFYLGFSPISALGYTAYSFINSTMLNREFVFPASFAVWCVLSVLILLVSLKFVRVRKSESAGNAFSHKFLPVLLTSVASIIAAFLFGFIFTGSIELNLFFGIFAIIGALLCGVVLNAVFNRNFKNIAKSLILSGATSVIYLAFMIVISTGGLGYVNNIPMADNVQSATYIVGGSWYGINTDLASTTITQKEDIESLIKVHSNVLKNKTKNKAEGGENLILTYTLKNGKKIQRRYDVMREFTENEFNLLDNIDCKMNNRSYKYSNKQSVTAYIVSYDEETGAETEQGNIYLTKAQAQKLADTYISEHKTSENYTRRVDLSNFSIKDNGADILNMDSEIHRNSAIITLNESYTETIKLIEEYISTCPKLNVDE